MLSIDAAHAQLACAALPFQIWGTVPAPGSAEFFSLGDAYLLRFHAIADFILSLDGSDVRCHPALDAQTPWEPIYHQQVLPLQRAQQGQPVFHGGAVSRGGHAVALLGPSGQGKSTLTAACAAQGMPFLTDDCLLLDEREGIAVVPDVDHIRMWQDSFEALTGAAAEPPPGAWRKPRLQADAGALPHRLEPARLACMIALDEEADDIVLTRLAPADAAMCWRANAFVVDLRSPQILRGCMQRAARLAEAVPAYRLTYPRDYARLPDVVAAVSVCLDAAVAGNAA